MEINKNGAQFMDAAEARSIARSAAQAAKARGIPTKCCGVGYRSWHRRGCIHFNVNGASTGCTGSW